MKKEKFIMHVRNDFPNTKLAEGEFIGPPMQTSFRDPLSKSDYVHKGPTVEELKREGKVGVYKALTS